MSPMFTQTCSIIVLVLQFWLAQSKAQHAPIVSTPLGRFAGVVRESEHGTKVYLYQGIRYGQATRFGYAKVFNASAQGVYNATSVRYACPQANLIVANGTEANTEDAKGEARYMSEDCLFMNIWSPATALDQRKQLPVMFFIHGGAFINGNIFMKVYDGRHLAALGDVVVVTVNYRLNAFGLLVEGDISNQGIHDQQLALDWTHDHIAHFGGHPDHITIFGESAGSASVSYQILAKTNHKHFKRAIMQSGTPNTMAPRAVGVALTHKMASTVGCATDNTMISCLKAKRVEQIINSNFIGGVIFGDSLFPLPPLELLKLPTPKPSLLIGVNQDEGISFIKGISQLVNSSDVNTLKASLNLYFSALSSHNLSHVIEHYMANITDKSSPKEKEEMLNKIVGEGYFKCPSFKFGEAMAQATENSTQRHYFYLLRQPADVPEVGCTKDMGVCHAADLIFLFGHPIGERHKFTDADYRLSKEMIHQWTTFAKTGRMDKVDKIKWPPAYDGRHQGVVNLMELADGKYRAQRYNFAEDICKVWQGLLFPM